MSLAKELDPLTACSLWLAILPVLSCTSAAAVAGGPGYDAGTFAVPGIKTGIGAQIEVIGYTRVNHGGLAVGPAFQLAGYATANDADPLVFTTFDVRYRRSPRATTRGGIYWEIGSGAGVAWSAGIRAAAVPVQAEIGVQRRAGSLLISVGGRERFIGLVGGGSPAFDASNSLQLVFRVRRDSGGQSLSAGSRR
jgi:hypothetical protein